MKRILIAAVAILTAQVAFAQSEAKSPEAARAAITKAEAAVQKAETKAAAKGKPVAFKVYLTEAKAYMDAYNAPKGNGWVGADRNQLQFLIKEKPSKSEMVELGGQQYQKDVYKACNYYYTTTGQLQMIEVTKPVFEDALDKALDAYAKAAKADVKGAKTKDIKAAIESISNNLVDEAYLQYTLGNSAAASAAFEKAAEAKNTAPLSQLDSSSVYNAAFTAWQAGNNERALDLFKKCYEIGYYYEDGEVYSKLNEVLGNLGRPEEGVAYLKEGFVKFPQSQSILINLINYYLTSGENPDELFALLDKAKANDPTNASLYYVEGNTHAKLGHEAEALAAYDKSLEVNPEYDFGHVGKGVFFYDKMIKIAEEANALDYSKWREYDQLMVKYYEAAEAAVEPFEAVYTNSKDENLKYNVAQYLRDIYFRLRNKDDKFTAGYEKYNEIVKAGKAE